MQRAGRVYDRRGDGRYDAPIRRGSSGGPGTGVTEVGTPYNWVWAERLPNAGLHETSGGHMGQTGPATRERLMRCVRTLTDGQPC